jgi:hypothetical protein
MIDNILSIILVILGLVVIIFAAPIFIGLFLACGIPCMFIICYLYLTHVIMEEIRSFLE